MILISQMAEQKFTLTHPDRKDQEREREREYRTIKAAVCPVMVNLTWVDGAYSCTLPASVVGGEPIKYYLSFYCSMFCGIIVSESLTYYL